MLQRIFHLKENGTDVRTEAIAGLTTFLSMVYILAVNPSILSAAGMEPGAVFTATAVSAAFASLCMAFFANYPVALASGMGINAYFAYSVCMPMAQDGIQDPWTIALTAVLVEGIIFILLSLTRFRETLVDEVPQNLKLGITAGIGLFIALIGLEEAGIVVGDPSTLVAVGDMGSPAFMLALAGFLLIAFMSHKKITGAVLWGILAVWILGILAQLAGWYQVDPEEGMNSLIPEFSQLSFIPQAPMLFDFDFSYVTDHFIEFAVIVFSFLYVDLFDTVGILIGVGSKAKLLDEKGRLPRVGRALMADAVGTVAGACLGTSTVTSYAESNAGIAQGGRTGLTAVVTAGLFIAALFFSPLFLAVPSFAVASALIYVGLLMADAIQKMNFESDIADSAGGFMAFLMMPLTYSIANGIMFGIITWVILKVLIGKGKSIHPVMWITFFLFVLRILTLVF